MSNQLILKPAWVPTAETLSSPTQMNSDALEALMKVAARPGRDHGSTIADLAKTWSTSLLAHMLRHAALADSKYESVLHFISNNVSLLEATQDGIRVGLGQLASGRGNIDQQVLQFAFYLISIGASGEFALEVDEYARVYLDVSLIEISGNLQVVAADSVCVITACQPSAEIRLHFRCSDGIWMEADNDLALCAGRAGRKIAVFNHDRPVRDPELLGVLELSQSSRDAIRRSLYDAIGLIELHDPVCLDWCLGILRGIVFVATPDGSTTSGSSSSHPGLIHISHPIDHDHLAAQIVHECAHQYLALVATQVALTTSDPNEVYFSPFKKTKRQLYNVLLALHAAVNIRSFTSKAIADGRRTAYMVSEDRQLAEDIDQMLLAISSAPGFTATGRRMLALLCDEPAP